MRQREREREREYSKFDVIYIDPPYNTEAAKGDGNSVANDKENIANNKFIYRDKFSRNGWLNMMNERLLMAKKLLREDGVIFVSIDDSEQAYLKVLMDEIFGEENFISNIHWRRTGQQQNNSKYVSNVAEHILVYGKNKLSVEITKDSIQKHKGLKQYNKRDSIGIFRLNPIQDKSLGKFEYSVVNPNTNKEVTSFNWRISKEKYLEYLKNNLIYWTKNLPNVKKYLKDNTGIARSNFIDSSVASNEKANILLQSIFGKSKIFDNPKPIELIKNLISWNKNKNARILDFFAGSGTTAQAVMELNREDGGNRTYTIVTNNENNIAYDVTYERLYRINKGIGTKGETFKWTEKNEPFKNNLNVYKTEYYDTEIDENNDSLINQKLKQNLKEEMNNFGINNFNNDSKEILTKLLSLKPQEKLN